jgi:hypothetical protein
MGDKTARDEKSSLACTAGLPPPPEDFGSGLILTHWSQFYE